MKIPQIIERLEKIYSKEDVDGFNMLDRHELNTINSAIKVLGKLEKENLTNTIDEYWGDIYNSRYIATALLKELEAGE